MLGFGVTAGCDDQGCRSTRRQAMDTAQERVVQPAVRRCSLSHIVQPPMVVEMTSARLPVLLLQCQKNENLPFPCRQRFERFAEQCAGAMDGSSADLHRSG